MTPPTRRALLALLLLVPAPSLGTWFSLAGEPGPVGKTIFLVSKIWLLLFPLVWVRFVDKKPLAFPKPRREGMGTACVTGVLIVGAIGGAYWLLGQSWIDASAMRAPAIAAGLDTPLTYVCLALYWITVNSLLEEYVWRWFVFTRCEELCGRTAAILLAALFFTLHHIIAVCVYFDWKVATLASLGVFVGGAIWSWLYLRYRNIWASYVSHVFADVIIFAIGYVLIFGS